MTTSLPEHGAHAPPPANAVVERSREAFRDPVARLPNWFRPGARNIGITSRQSSPTLAPFALSPTSHSFGRAITHKTTLIGDATVALSRGESAKPLRGGQSPLSRLLAASPRSRLMGKASHVARGESAKPPDPD